MRAFVTIFIVLIFSPSYAAEFSPIPDSIKISKHPKADVPFDLVYLKSLWKKRILAIREKGELPIIDIESAFNPGKVNAKKYAKAMDKNGIALTAFSPGVGMKKYKNGALWNEGARHAVGADPSRFIPTSTAGIYPAFTEEPGAFVKETNSIGGAR